MDALVELLVLVALLSSVVICDGTSVYYHHDDNIVTKTKVELSPVHITTSLNEILALSSPIVNCKGAEYQLRRPNGDIIRTEILKPNSKKALFNTNLEDDIDEQNKIIFKYINKDIRAMYPRKTYKQFNLRDDDWTFDESVDVIKTEEKMMNRNDFMIGPLLAEDHGNWVLSIYCQDIDAEWIEMFQVITVDIRTYVDMEQSGAIVPVGGTFNLSFLYPIKDLETCELVIPKSSAGRFFDRTRIELDKCGYVITNITKNDEGIWRVIGVGRIVYEGVVRLKVDDPSENELDNLYN